jgi:dGTPase
LADKIAYINHDIDDAVRAGIIRSSDIPGPIAAVLGERHGERIDTLVRDVIECSGGALRQSPAAADAMQKLRSFMFERVYRNPEAKSEESKAQAMLLALFEFYVGHPDELPEDFRSGMEREGRERTVCDYIAGMTDNYAAEKYAEYFIPSGWAKK